MARNELLLAQPLPSTGEAPAPDFPLGQIEEHLSNQRFRLHDEKSGVFFLCGTSAATQFARIRIFSEPDEPMPSVVMIRLAPGEIQIWQRADNPALAQAREFAEWLLANFPCAIRTPAGEDISSALDLEYGAA